MKKVLGFVGILGVLVLGYVNFALCGTVTVSGTTTVFTTIQAGVNACPVGGTVSVSAGTYNETVYINKRIALVGVGIPTITAAGLGNTSTVTFDVAGTSISGFIITGASGYNYNYGIFCKNGASPTITNNTISGNNWNGILCVSSSPTITDNTISENSYCGIICSSSSPTITDNTITGNGGEHGVIGGGKGIACHSSSPTITNNTISGNSCEGIYCAYSSSPTITNNIITENGTTSTDYYGIYATSTSTPIINYNCVWGNGQGGNNNYWQCSGGLGSITANPQFIGIGDFHLQATSPCIDTGSNTAPGIPEKDKDGNPRIVNGIVDMGAYEYQGTITPPGFSISGRNLIDANGNIFVMRGINHGHCWYTNKTSQAIADIKAVGANCVRIACSNGREGWTQTTANDITNIINFCKANKLIVILELHDTTGYGENSNASTLSAAANYWNSVKSALIGQEAYTIINIGNEPYGNNNTGNWVADCKSAIQTMRNNGFTHTIIVDAPNWGQDWEFYMKDNAQAIFDSDSQKNTILSVHMYGVYDTITEIQSYIDAFKNKNLPLCIGEFGHNHSDGDPDEDTIMSYSQSNGIGWMAWSWCGNTGGVEYLDLVNNWNKDNPTSWGTRIFTGTNGLSLTSNECSIFSNVPTAKLEVATGTPQTATVTTTLQPFVAKLTDNLNRPIQGHTIKWTLVSAPATSSLSATLTTTDAEGLASITLTLGTKAGTYIVTAEGSLRATFTATATVDVLHHINISPAEPSIAVNQPFPFMANGYDQFNNEIAELIYDWAIEGDIGSLTLTNGTSTSLISTSTPAVGTISAGTLTVTGKTKVSVVYGQLTSVTINPATATVEMLGSQPFTAQALNQYGFPIAGATYTWTLKTAGMGTLDTTTGQTVVFTATKTGTVYLQVKAEFGTRTANATATITVVKGLVHHINITPATTTIEARGTSSFTARAYNQYGYELTDVTKFGWQIIEGSGTVNGNPGQTVVLTTNDVVGTLTLTASTNTVTGTATVEVIHGSVTSVSINPPAALVEVEGSQTFTASSLNRFGHPIPASTLIYTWGLNSSIGGSITPTTVSGTTTFTAGSKTGKVEITAEAEGKKSATTTVTVTPGPIEKLVFIEPTVGSLTVGMPGTMSVQAQDRFGNPGQPIAIPIVISGDEQSRFAEVSSGVTWTTSGTFTIAGTSNRTFFFKQNGTTTPVGSVTITATIVGTTTFATHTITIEVLGSSSSGIVVGDDGKTTVEIGTGAVTGAGYIEIDTSGTSTATIVLAGNAKDDADPRINRVEGTLRRFEIHDATITTTVRIGIPYPDADDDGYVDGVTSPMQESSLVIYHLVGTGTAARWESVTSWVDTVNNVVYADVSGFSFYTLMGAGFEPNLEKALVYPNPFYANKHTLIYFDRLTENSTIQIFTIAGELVDEIRADSSRMGWDTRNSAGEKVASGIYIYLIKDLAGNKKVGKLAVIR